MFKNFDRGIVIAIIFIFSLGLTILYSVAPEFFSHQLIYFALGLVFFFFFANFDYRFFQNFFGFLYFFSLAFLLSPFFLGTITRGTSRWLTIGVFTLQPSELVKPLLILSFAGWAAAKDLKKARNLLSLLLLFLPVAFLVFYQPALGSMLVVLAIFLAILLMSNMKLVHFFLAFFSGSLLLPLVWRFLADYQKKRILAFLDPGKDPLDSGYHLIQSRIAVGSGRIFGKGLGQGTQSHLRFLPEFQSDFIFAALAEELGLMGCLILFVCYFFLFWRILKIAENSQTKFGFLICVGVFTMLFFQFFVNIGMNIGLLPISGITLPLVSSGGSSLIATLISLGLVENIARVGKKSL